MHISYWPEYRALNSNEPYWALINSIHENGHTIKQNCFDADAAILWSVLWHGKMAGNQKIWEYYRKQNKPVIVVEVGGINRGTTWKVGVNGINRSAYFGPNGNNRDRCDTLGLQVKPWRTNGKYILICGQHDKSLQWQDMPSMSNWFLQTYDDIRKYTDRPIIFRPHPRCRLPEIERGLKYVYRQEPKHVANSYDDFDMDFNDIWATVNWSSNPGIHSIINGIPAFVGSNSLASPVANNIGNLANIENPVMPDRTQWLNDYAWTEYTVDEIAKGVSLKRLLPFLMEQIQLINRTHCG